MNRLRSTLFEPSERHDVPLRSRRGFLAGLFQAALHLVAFAALFVLGLVTDVVSTGVAEPSALLFWGAVGGAAALGAVMVGLATVDRVKRFWRVPAARLATVAGVYLAFWGLLVLDVPAALVAGPAFVGARVAAHAWLVLAGS